jgi:8-oxo-dGTP pyrophosphatase MutT (NUDIX family)
VITIDLDDDVSEDWLRDLNAFAASQVVTKAADPTAAAFLLIRAQNEDGKWRYLLQHRTDGTWGLPGGGLHPGEDPWEGALRESTEELGELPSLGHVMTIERDDDDLEVTTFVCELPALFQPSVDGSTPEETEGWGWFSRKQVGKLPLHPAFEELWDSVDWKHLGEAGKKRFNPLELRGEHGEWSGGEDSSNVTVDNSGIVRDGDTISGVVGQDASGWNFMSMDGRTESGFNSRDEAVGAMIKPTDESAKPQPEAAAAAAANPVSPTGVPSIRSGSLTIAERMSVSGYTSESGNRIYNDELRNGNPGSDYVYQDLDSAIGKSTVTSGGTVYRGIALPDAMKLETGTEFQDLGYVSTSSDKNVAREFADMRATGTSENLDAGSVKALGGTPTVMAIELPAGSHAMYGDRSVKEIILPRGTTFVVTGISDDGTVNVKIK